MAGSQGEVNSSESASISEWTMYGRTLNNSFYYPGYVPPNISTLIMKNFSTSNSIGQQTIITILDGFAYATDWTYVHKLNITNFTQEVSRSGSISPYSSPVLWNNSVYVGSSSAVRQLNVSNLSQTIATKTGITGYVYHSPIVSGGYLYFGGFNDGLVYQVNASNITQSVKTYNVGGRCYAGPSISGDNLYIPCASTIYQLNASNVSQKIADLNTGSGTISYGMTPLIAKGYVYFGSDNDRFYQVNASNVSIHIANFTTGFDVLGSPVYSNDAVYFGNSNGTLYQVNASNITLQIANISLGGAINTPITLTPDYLFVGAGNRLYQINISNISNVITSISIGSSPSAISIADGIIYIGDSSRFHQIVPNGTIVIQNSPASNHSISNSSTIVSFSCSALNVLGLNNISIYLTNNLSAGLTLNQSSTITGIYNSSLWSIDLDTGNYTWTCGATDRTGLNVFGENRSLSVSFVDGDGDGVSDSEDSLEGNESNVNKTGISNLNITIGGNSTTGSFSGLQEVAFYDSSTKILNFSHNFSVSEINLNKVTLFKDDNYILINLSSQLQGIYNKTIFVNDNSFATLCAKDQEISSISDIGSDCTGDSEFDLTACIGNSTQGTYGYLTCQDNGAVISIGNLGHSGIRGFAAETSTSETEEETPLPGTGSSYINQITIGGNELAFDIRISKGLSISTKVLDDARIGIKEVELRAKDWLTGEVKIKSYKDRPDNCIIKYDQPYKIYKTIEIEHSFKDSKLDNARIRLGIEKKWIENNGVSEIVVVRCNPEYQELISSYVEEDKHEGIYDIYSQGFSTWALLGIIPPEQVNSSPVNEKIFPWSVFWISLVVCAIVLLVGFLYRRKARIQEGMHLHTKLFDLDWSLKIKFNRPPHERGFQPH